MFVALLAVARTDQQNKAVQLALEATALWTLSFGARVRITFVYAHKPAERRSSWDAVKTVMRMLKVITDYVIGRAPRGATLQVVPQTVRMSEFRGWSELLRW